MRRSSVIVLGLALIGLGIITGGNALHIWDINVFFDGWWTLFLIIPGLVSLMQNGPNAGNLILIIFGGCLLLTSQDFIPSGLLARLAFPIILILCGAALLVGKIRHKGNWDETGFPTYRAVFGAAQAKNTSQDFQGANINVLLGGAEIDLRQAKLRQDAEINVSAILGGVELFVPLDVKVEVRGTPILGGIENSARFPHTEDSPTVYINCTAVLGGIEIK